MAFAFVIVFTVILILVLNGIDESVTKWNGHTSLLVNERVV
jgi:hypothetical protein